MKKHLALLAVIASTGLAGCASLPPSSMSYVSPKITASDANFLASDAARQLSRPLPPAKTTLVLDPPQTRQGNVLTPAFEHVLRAKGYAVTELNPNPAKDAPPQKGVQLRYLASPLDAGVLLRLQYEGVEAARFYPRTKDGALTIGAPFTVREAHQ